MLGIGEMKTEELEVKTRGETGIKERGNIEVRGTRMREKKRTEEMKNEETGEEEDRKEGSD